ncbi:MAG: exo-alpha-sialidase, partial [Victivallales bacterium]|nr:exo-alpha-sialidase [Victivallales bacterium]
MKFSYSSAIGELQISEAELYIDNQSRGRSGHMTHAMIEYAHGKIIDFNSNCSAVRLHGHSAFCFIEYRYSEDGGKSWSGSHELPVSKEILLDGIYSVSMEKAVYNDGVITGFLLRNTQKETICCEPWDTSLVVQSRDLGKTWSTPVEFSPDKGRIYDAVVRDGVIYVIIACNEHFAVPGTPFKLYTSTDNGLTFQEKSSFNYGEANGCYNAIIFTDDGAMLSYACNYHDSMKIEVCRSRDLGETWELLPPVQLSMGLRNIQIARLNGGFVMHGRGCFGAAWGKGEVIYTSKDGYTWDEGLCMEPEKTSCYYSNMLSLKDGNGKDY